MREYRVPHPPPSLLGKDGNESLHRVIGGAPLQRAFLASQSSRLHRRGNPVEVPSPRIPLVIPSAATEGSGVEGPAFPPDSGSILVLRAIRGCLCARVLSVKSV